MAKYKDQQPSFQDAGRHQISEKPGPPHSGHIKVRATAPGFLSTRIFFLILAATTRNIHFVF